MASLGGIWELADVLSRKARRTEGRVPATYLYTDDVGTAWVLLAGADEPTPVTGMVTADLRRGDVVEAVVGGGTVSVSGNVSSPSVGARVVAAAIAPVSAAVTLVSEATDAARDIAEAAQHVADAIGQHLWADDSGIHVTHATQEDWNTGHSGPNVLLNSVGQLFRDGLNNLVAITTEQGARAISFYDGLGNLAGNITAYFGSDGVRIGKSESAHVSISPAGYVQILNGQGVVAHMGMLTGDAASTVLCDDTEIGVPYSLPADLAGIATIDLDSTTLSSSDYSVVGGQVTLLGTPTVQRVFDGAVTEDGIPVPVALSLKYVRSNGAGLSVGGQATRPGFESHGPSRFSHPSAALAQHSSPMANCGFRAKRADSTGDVSFVVGTGGVNHGVWSNTLNRWLTYGDNARMYLNGGRIGVSNNGFEAVRVKTLSIVAQNSDTTQPGVTHWRMTLTDYGNLRLDRSADNKATWETVGYYRRNDQPVPAADITGAFDDTQTIDRHSLIATSNSIDHNTTLSSDTGGTGVYLREATGDGNIAYVRSFGRSGADRLRGVQLGGHNMATDTWNMLYLLTDRYGNRVVQVSEAAPWRTALGLGSTATMSTIPIANGGTGATTRVEALEAFSLAFIPGDTVSGTVHTAGYVTNSGKNYVFTVPIAKNIEGTLTLSSMTLIARQDNKYVVGSSSAGQDVKSVTTVTRTAHGLGITVALATAPTNVTNNSAVGIVAAYSFAVS